MTLNMCYYSKTRKLHGGGHRTPLRVTRPESHQKSLAGILAKRSTKDELVKGIQDFWGSVSGEKCRKYNQHLQKVMPKVIELGGAATG